MMRYLIAAFASAALVVGSAFLAGFGPIWP
jgi:hypothetical protein